MPKPTYLYLLRKTDAKIMRFSLSRTSNYLLRHKEIYTVRDYLNADKVEVYIPQIGRFATRTFVGPIRSKDDLELYVYRSGFRTVCEWWDAIRRFTRSKKLYLYHVTMKRRSLGELDKLKMYLATHRRNQLRDASEYLSVTAQPFEYFVVDNYTYSGIIQGKHGKYVVQIDALNDEVACSCWGNRGGGRICWHIVAMLLYLVVERYLDENIATHILRNHRVRRGEVTILRYI